MNHNSFPTTRMRRTRQAEWIRSMVRETRLAPEQLIQPLFVAEGDLLGPVKSMPGMARLSLVELQRELKTLYKLGIKAVAIFPVIPAAKKTEDGAEALNPSGLVPRAIAAAKKACPQ
ncbi:MAG: porphobilinogen synthase, partial [Hydrocarboniphaga effusa]|nr:porphobilinogen synthase [Hydrocarboniphaga effusa]